LADYKNDSINRILKQKYLVVDRSSGLATGEKVTMSALQNRIRQPVLAFPAGLERLLLRCQFDLRQKCWGLPSGERGRDVPFAADLVALVRAVSRCDSDSSDPARGGANPAKTAPRRMGVRHLFRRSWGKTKQPRKEK
jgi:hypothetical protein